VADATSKLCKLAASSCVLGLPHVLRTVSKDGENLAALLMDQTKQRAFVRAQNLFILCECHAGAQIVHDVLTNSLPDSVFPSPTPFSGKKDGYTMQLLSSVQVQSLTRASLRLEEQS
jgi:hypothetical protein